MKQIFTLLILLNCCLAGRVFGQANDAFEAPVPDYASGTFYTGLIYSRPLGDYRQVYPRADALGGTIGLLLNPRKGSSPLELGMQVNFLSQGRTLNRTAPGTFFSTLKTTHTIYPLHLVARVKPMHNLKFRPYLDGLAGMTVFNTRSKVKEDFFEYLFNQDETILLSKHNTSVMSYGIGVGVLFNSNKSTDTFADLRITYLQSPNADYVQKRGVRVQQDGFPLYQFTRSETSMLLVQLNIAGMLR